MCAWRHSCFAYFIAEHAHGVIAGFVRQWSKIGNYPRETGANKADIDSLPPKSEIFRGALSKNSFQVRLGTELWPDLHGLSQDTIGLIEFVPQCKRRRQERVNVEQPRISRPSPPKPSDGFFCIAQQKLTKAQDSLVHRGIAVMRRQPKTSLDKRNCRFGMSKESQRYPQLTHRLDVVRRLCNSHFKLDPGIVQAPLCTTKHSHVGMSIGIVSIIAEKFDKQLFGSCFILLRSQSPAVQDIAHQHVCNAIFGIDRTRVAVESLFEAPESFVPIC